MHPFDVIVGAAIAFGIVRGYAGGFFKQAGAVVGFVLAFALGAGLMESVGGLLSSNTNIAADMAPLAAFLLVFVIVYLSVMVVVKLAEDAFGAMKLSFVNKIAGAAAGGIKVALLVSVLLMALAYVNVPSEETRRESSLYAPVSMLGPRVWSWISANGDIFEELTRRIQSEIGQRVNPEDMPSATSPE